MENDDKPKAWELKAVMAWPRILTKDERDHVFRVMSDGVECDCPVCAEGKTPKVEWVAEWWMPGQNG